MEMVELLKWYCRFGVIDLQSQVQKSQFERKFLRQMHGVKNVFEMFVIYIIGILACMKIAILCMCA